VQEAHQHGKGISLGIGGYIINMKFPTLIRTRKSRRSFVTKLAKAMEKYDLDGLNIDWEYPNDPNGISCNKKNPKDTENFLLFILELRQMLDSTYVDQHKLITAAVSTDVFKDQDQKPIAKLDKRWAEAMDAFYIMAYDISGSWSDFTASNAPLYSDKQSISGSSSIEAWIRAGIPSQRIYLGVPFYGYTHKTLASQPGMNIKLDRSIPQIKGDTYDDYLADPCPDAKPTFSGQIQWRSINNMGIQRNESGWTTMFDQKSMTPFANHPTGQFITFDNQESLQFKTKYAQDHQLGGVMLWSLEMDDTDHTLLNALQAIRV
ncbi:hypothetical protein CU098_003049, partial [Rhizopus stolonifer]